MPQHPLSSQTGDCVGSQSQCSLAGRTKAAGGLLLPILQLEISGNPAVVLVLSECLCPSASCRACLKDVSFPSEFLCQSNSSTLTRTGTRSFSDGSRLTLHPSEG